MTDAEISKMSMDELLDGYQSACISVGDGRQVTRAYNEARVIRAELDARIEAAASSLSDLLTWIMHWDPNFTNDREWPASKSSATKALARLKGTGHE